MALTATQIAQLRSAPVGDNWNRLRVAMKLVEVTQEQLAEAINESQPYISDVVRGRYQTITLAKAQKFSQYFGCLIEDIFPAREALSA